MYSIAQNSWTVLANAVEASPQGLAVVAGELTLFGANLVQILRNGAWQNADSQTVGEMKDYPALVLLP